MLLNRVFTPSSRLSEQVRRVLSETVRRVPCALGHRRNVAKAQNEGERWVVRMHDGGPAHKARCWRPDVLVAVGASTPPKPAMFPMGTSAVTIERDGRRKFENRSTGRGRGTTYPDRKA
jgi:hypothetical protein